MMILRGLVLIFGEVVTSRMGGRVCGRISVEVASVLPKLVRVGYYCSCGVGMEVVGCNFFNCGRRRRGALR